MIQVAYGAVSKLEIMISIINFLPNEVDIGFKLNPGFVPGFFCAEAVAVVEGANHPFPARWNDPYRPLTSRRDEQFHQVAVKVDARTATPVSRSW